MKKSYQYILLDWDGNLAKTLDLWMDILRDALLRRGVVRDDYELGASLGAFSTYAQNDWHVDFDELWAELNIYAREKLPSVELYPDALEVLKSLDNSGKNLALVTTSKHAVIAPILQKHDLLKYFQVITAGDDVTHRKPHPEPLEVALNELGGTRGSAIMVGDTDKDIEAANNFGCDSILFYPPEHEKFYKLESFNKHKPTYTIRDFRKVIDIVN